MAKEPGLQPEHLLDLSGKITEELELLKLGLRLGVDHTKIESSVKNRPNNLQLATKDVLQHWIQGKGNDKCQAYNSLCSALRSCERNDLADELQQQAEGTGNGAESSDPSAERLQNIARWTKESFTGKPFCRAFGPDWKLPQPRTAPDLKETYMKPRLVQKLRKAHTVERRELEDLTDIFKQEELNQGGPVRILVQAAGGMGKSTAMKYLAISWADGTVDDLKKFDFLFHISLKHVTDNSSIEDIIIRQHKGLKANGVKPEEIKSIIKGERNKVMIVVDGHDEYKPGRNPDIDAALNKESLWNCWIVLTSRETEQIKELKDVMDVEVEIQGFTEMNIIDYISRSLGGQETAAELLIQAVVSGLCVSLGRGKYDLNNSLLSTPILLNMICVLFKSKQALPRTIFGIMNAIVNSYLDREAIRSKGKRAEDDAKQALCHLGKLAWKGLQESRLIFEKEEVIQVAGEEALDIGILSGIVLEAEEVDGLMFPHLQFQEFVAAKYVAERPQHDLEESFPDWIYIQQDASCVILFATALTDEPEKFLDVIYNRLFACLGQNIFHSSDVRFLDILRDDLQDKVAMDTFHNVYFNHITRQRPKVHVPSKYYVLHDAVPECASVELQIDESALHAAEPAECSIRVSDLTTLLNSLKILCDIQEHQKVSLTHFALTNCTQRLLENQITDLFKRALTFHKKSKIVDIRNCYFPQEAFQHIVHQLCHCEQLDILRLREIAQNVPQTIGQALEAMISLRILNVGNLLISSDVTRIMMSAASACTNLELLNLNNTKLTGCMELLLGSSNQLGFPKMTVLFLSNTKLSAADLRTIAEAVNLHKMPQLHTLNLSKNMLSNCLTSLLLVDKDNHGKYSQLHALVLRDTKLTKRDVAVLSRSFQLNKLPTLDVLDISQNRLTNCLETFSQVQSTPIHVLELRQCQLSRQDIKEVGMFLNTSDNMRLNLRGTVLTGCLSLLVACKSHHLEILDLQKTELNKDDILSLTDAIESEHLPQLSALNLCENDFRDIETTLDNFFKMCTKMFERKPLLVSISPDDVSNPDSFLQKVTALCKGSMVSVTIGSPSGSHFTADIYGVLHDIAQLVDENQRIPDFLDYVP